MIPHLSREQIKKAFNLHPRQAIGIALFGLAILAVANISVITLRLTAGTILAKSEVQDSFAQQLKSWFASPVFNTITLVVFWVAIGLVAYSVLYWVYTIYSEAKNEVVVEKEYTSLKTVEEKKSWPLVEAGLLATLVLFAILTLTVLFPLINSWFIGFLFDISTNIAAALVSLFAAVLGMFVVIYVIKSLISLMLIIE